MFKKVLFIELTISVFLLGFLNFVANQRHWYWTIDSFDLFMHFLGGFSVVTFFLWIYFFSSFFAPEKRKLKNFFSIAMLGLVFVSVSWEIFEIVTETAVLSWSDYPFDTTLDYVMDFFGGVTACLYAYLRELSHKENRFIKN